MSDSAHIRQKVNKLKQELIFSKAIDLFYRHGYRGTSMGQIAAELGVTKPFLYYRFRNKAQILDEVFSRTEALVLDATVGMLAASDSPEVKLRSIVRQVVEAAFDNRRLLAVFYNEERNLPSHQIERSRQLRIEWQENIAKLLEEGRGKAAFNFRDIGIAVHAILGAMLWSYHWVSEYGIDARSFVVDELTEATLAIVLIPAGKK